MFNISNFEMSDGEINTYIENTQGSQQSFMKLINKVYNRGGGALIHVTSDKHFSTLFY